MFELNWLENISSYLLSFEYFSIAFLFIANSIYVVILLFGYLNSRRLYQSSRIQNSRLNIMKESLKPISLLVPAYNEELSIITSIRSMLKLTYHEFEVVLVNDGSKDNTLKSLIDEFHLVAVEEYQNIIIPTKPINAIYKSSQYPNLSVIDKVNGGKADALNCAINFAKYPLVCCVDSDSLFDEEGLNRVAIPFFEHPDEMMAVGGTIRVVNHSEIKFGKVVRPKIKWNYLLLVQTVEYLRAFLVGRMGWDFIQCNTIISGAFGLFRKKAIIDVGGYGSNTVGEDLELLLKMHQYYKKRKEPYRVQFLPDPICWTQVPSDFKTLGNQRSRWTQGLAEGLISSRGMFFRPWSGSIGWFALPYLLIFELLAAPIEFLAYLVNFIGLYLGIIKFELFVLFLSVSIFYGWILTFCAVIIEELTFQKYKKFSDFFKLILGTILEQIGFRQLHLFYRLRGIWRYLRGNTQWGVMKREGF